MLFLQVGNSGEFLLLGAEKFSLNLVQKDTQEKHIEYLHTFTHAHTHWTILHVEKPNNKKPFNKYNVIKFQNYTRYYDLTNTITSE